MEPSYRIRDIYFEMSEKYQRRDDYCLWVDAIRQFLDEFAENPLMYQKKQVKVGPPPVHTHYNEENQKSELCGRVFCPQGFVGITVSNEEPKSGTVSYGIGENAELIAAERRGEERMKEKIKSKVGSLRQWLNESPLQLITNEHLIKWLEL